MIKKIKWNKKTHFQTISPFEDTTSERLLKITFHTKSLQNVPLDLQSIVDMLFEITTLPLFEVVNTDKSRSPYMEFSAYDKFIDRIPVDTKGGKWEHHTSIPNQLELTKIVSSILDVDTSDELAQKVVGDLMCVEAHKMIKFDIFVTEDEFLLSCKDNYWLRNVNIMNLRETITFLGLYLRFKNSYVYSVNHNYIAQMRDGLSFYEEMVFAKIENILGAIYNLTAIEKVSQNDLSYLAGTLLTRCRHALRSRDKVGFCFYSVQSGDTIDEMMYEFNYLLLLLHGALEVVAIICVTIYDLPLSQPSFVGTGNKRNDFIKHLQKKGAKSLCDLMEHKSTKALMVLLREIRNTIHRFNYPVATAKRNYMGEFVERQTSRLGVVKVNDTEIAYITIPHIYLQEIMEATIASPKEWGLENIFNKWHIEPYTYACTLTNNVFELIEKVLSEINWNYQNIPLPQLPKLTESETRRRNRIFLLS
jgi:hypothetical protein